MYHNAEFLAKALRNTFDYAVDTSPLFYQFEDYYTLPGICELTEDEDKQGYPYPGSDSLAVATEPMKFGYWLTVYYSHNGERTWLNVHQGNSIVKTYQLVQY